MPEESVAPVVSALTERLRAMVAIGLGYLHLGLGGPLTPLTGDEGHSARRAPKRVRQ